MVAIQKMRVERSLITKFILFYFLLAAVGWLLLQLPISQNTHVKDLDHLFTAVSAISTTGLVSVDVGKAYSFFGQFILLLLIQFGGILFMIFSYFIILSYKQKPINYNLVKQVFLFTSTCEVIGAVLLYFFFRNAGIEHPFWNAIFHSISAFCAAGFSLFSSNLLGFRDHLGINVTLSLLSIFGCVGLFLWLDSFKRMALRTFRAFTTWVILAGALLFMLMAHQNMVIAFFQTISAATTVGFNTIDLKILPSIGLFLLMVLMLYGGALTGNGINMKSTSVIGLMKLVFDMQKSYRRGQKVLLKRILFTLSTCICFLLTLTIFLGPLLLFEKESTLSLLFEAVSALCTVGLSMGITAELSAFGKSMIILLMLIGRSGILILGFVLSSQLMKMRSADVVSSVKPFV